MAMIICGLSPLLTLALALTYGANLIIVMTSYVLTMRCSCWHYQTPLPGPKRPSTARLLVQRLRTEPEAPVRQRAVCQHTGVPLTEPRSCG